MQNVRGRHFLYGEWMNFSENSYENVSKTECGGRRMA